MGEDPDNFRPEFRDSIRACWKLEHSHRRPTRILHEVRTKVSDGLQLKTTDTSIRIERYFSIGNRFAAMHRRLQVFHACCNPPYGLSNDLGCGKQQNRFAVCRHLPTERASDIRRDDSNLVLTGPKRQCNICPLDPSRLGT